MEPVNDEYAMGSVQRVQVVANRAEFFDREYDHGHVH